MEGGGEDRGKMGSERRGREVRKNEKGREEEMEGRREKKRWRRGERRRDGKRWGGRSRRV